MVDADGLDGLQAGRGQRERAANGKIVYWNALEGTERIERSLDHRVRRVALNDQTRLLDLARRRSSGRVPDAVRRRREPGGYDNGPLIPGGNSETNNDGALFCSDLTFLPDGRVHRHRRHRLLPGPGGRATRIRRGRSSRACATRASTTRRPTLDADRLMKSAAGTRRWSSSANGKRVRGERREKLLKPVYPDRRWTRARNVTQTETYDPASGKWTDNGAAGERSLPLFPRLHLLPNGDVYYNAAGQSFNPFGQSYDEALWNNAASYDPAPRRWKDLGIPGLDGGSLGNLLDLDFGKPVSDLASFGIPGGGKSAHVPGFRGSTFSVMLPLQPDAERPLHEGVASSPPAAC